MEEDMKKIVFILIFNLLVFNGWSQISTKELPISFNREIFDGSNMEQILNEKVLVEKKTSKTKSKVVKKILQPYKYGDVLSVCLTPSNSGRWHTLQNGDKIWQLCISSPGAKSINLTYDKFWIPEKGKLFIFTPDKKHWMGAFTSKNNKGKKENPGGFASGVLMSDEIILEYYQPHNVNDSAIISISEVVYGNNDLSSFFLGYGLSCSNQVNINCPEGTNWQDEKNAVACILHDGYVCTGALVNNTDNDCQPLLLTANHCLNGQDAVTSPNLNNWIFYWNYETQGCDISTLVTQIPSTVGATILANKNDTDFALLYLTEDPKDLSNYIPYYLGWDCTNSATSGSVCIHHPKGDSKKIAYANYPLNTNSELMWRVKFMQTQNGYGIPEEGSSGAPLLNWNHRIMGQLKDGNPSCDNPSNSTFNFGKFGVSWNGNVTSNSKRRLCDWLDPHQTGATALDGKYPDQPIVESGIIGPNIICDSAIYYVHGVTNNQTVTWTRTNQQYICIFQTDYPYINQCMIKRSNNTPYWCTLTATVYEEGSIVSQYTKDILVKYDFEGHYNQESCTYNGVTHPAISSKSLNLHSAQFVHMGCQVHVTSDCFKRMNVGHRGAIPSYFNYDGESGVDFILPLSAGGAPFYITVSSEEGCYDLELLFFAISANGNLSNNQLVLTPVSHGYQIHIVRDEPIQDSHIKEKKSKSFNSYYPIEVYNIRNGKNILKDQIIENSYIIDTLHWEKGVYIIRVVIEGEVYTNKIVVE